MTEGSRSLANPRGGEKNVRPAGKSRAARWDIDDIVDALRQSREVVHNIRHGGVARRLPSRTALAELINGISAVLFPTHYGQPDLDAGSVDEFVRNKLRDSLGTLVEQIRLSLPLAASETRLESESAGRVAQDIAQEFAAQLPEIRAQLAEDLRAAYQGDPSASSMPEILLGYPGMVAIICYRLARALHLLGAPLVARLMTLVAHSRTGIDIHPGAEIGTGFFIDHGTGVVIGETAIIGKKVRLSQAVTLGAMRSAAGARGLALKGVARHPILEDDVFVHAGATLLGRITVGRGSVIGGNVWLTRSVPPGSNIVQPQLRGLGYDGEQK
ncbi:MAG TPA: serine acetyltransferase [Rhizomicrobium sp.]|jgi:serine O-acetyltransferase|nr:serine acetyltransferase [Rhizomicrobium sp.]